MIKNTSRRNVTSIWIFPKPGIANANKGGSANKLIQVI
jgi:hypothetical protein